MLEEKETGFILHKAAMAAKYDFTNQLSRFGITPGQLTVINEIDHHMKRTGEPGLAPACIAERISCDRPTMTGIIERLELQGWIARLQNPEDKRSCLIRLTAKAEDHLEELNRINREHQDMLLKGFTEEEAKLFRSFLYRVFSNFAE